MADQTEDSPIQENQESEKQQEEVKKIVVSVKTPKEKQNIEVPENATIKEFKELVAVKFNADVEQICLIFAGKIMKDQDTLETHNIKNGLTVHLVIKTAPRPTQSGPSRPPADISATPFNLGNMGGLLGLESLGVGSVNFMELQNRMQTELLGNPELLRHVLDNPVVQRLMNDPENMRTLITSNPQMRELIDRNPEINHMLNNPELLRQTMELARNPSMLQELMRSHDRAINNLESIPGGYNALQRMYRDIQEPMLNAASEQFHGNPFAAFFDNGSNTTTTGNPQQGTENRDPLPNPWSSQSRTTEQSSTPRPQAQPQPQTPTQSQSRSGFMTARMLSLLQQMTENPQLVQNMLSAPYFQSMVQAMAADPNMAQSIFAQNPLFAENPALLETIQNMTPQLMQQLQNPEIQNLLTNPQALDALIQIQQGMETLRDTVPSVVASLRPNQITRTPPITTANTTIQASSNTTTTTTASGGADALPQSNLPNDSFSEFMARMVSNLAVQHDNNALPEERYREQLNQLEAMGFRNRDANLQALTATFGNINAAIERLLGLNQPFRS